MQSASEISKRNRAVQAVRSGATITEAACQAGVTRSTLYRWLKAFDPDRPRSSLHPQKRGPKAPRWEGEVVSTVINLIRDHPDLWGRHRVTLGLAERGITVSEATVSRILPVARERIAIERDRKERARRSRRSREVAAMTRRDERDARREAEVRQWFERTSIPASRPRKQFSTLLSRFLKPAGKYGQRISRQHCESWPTLIAGPFAMIPSYPPRTSGCVIPRAGKIRITPVWLL